MKPKNTICLWFDKGERSDTTCSSCASWGFFPPSEPALN
jgi:hypothetical protein